MTKIRLLHSFGRPRVARYYIHIYVYIYITYLATQGLPYECTKCKQGNRILVICAHCPRNPWELLKYYWLSIDQCADNGRRLPKLDFFRLHLVQSYVRFWKKGDWVHACSIYRVLLCGCPPPTSTLGILRFFYSSSRGAQVFRIRGGDKFLPGRRCIIFGRKYHLQVCNSPLPSPLAPLFFGLVLYVKEVLPIIA